MNGTDNVNREMKILRKKSQRNALEIKNTVTDMKNAFGGLIKYTEQAEDRIFTLEDILVESSKT